MTDQTATKLRVRLFADGADLASIRKLCANPLIAGFTTNPSLMRRAGVQDYATFAREMLAEVTDRPVSFEVLSDDLDEMRREAECIAAWGENVYVKVPVTNTAGVSTAAVCRDLSRAGVRVNVTAILTREQVAGVLDSVAGGAGAYISVFAGRIADTGRDPVPVMREVVDMLRPHPDVELIWASPREVLNVIQADSIGCHIITMTPDLLAKIALFGRDLDEYSLDTVKMFQRDAVAADFRVQGVPATAAVAAKNGRAGMPVRA